MRYWRIAACVALVGLGAVIAAMRAQDAWNAKPVLVKLVVPAAFAVARDFDFGRYRLRWLGHGFSIHAQGQPDRALWGVQGGFVGAGNARTREREGYWQSRLVERRDLLCLEQSLESFERQGGRLTLRGHLRCNDGRVTPYSVTFSDDHEQEIRLLIELADPRMNRLYLSWSRMGGERVAGLGGVGSSTDVPVSRIDFGGAGGRRQAANCLVSGWSSFCTEAGSVQWIDLRGGADVRLEVHARQLVGYLSGGKRDRPMPILRAPK